MGGTYYKTYSFNNVKKSCVGNSIVAYIDNDNNLWLAGYDGYFFPFQETPILYETNVVEVAYADESTLFFIKENGDLYGVGSDRFHQLIGKGNKKDTSPYETYYYADEPIKLMEDVKSVTACDRNCAVIKNDNSLWMWGEYDFFDHLMLYEPTKISDDVIQASIGASQPVSFVKNDNTGWYVDNKTLNINKIGDNISCISGAVKRGFYITTDNELYGWGVNGNGQRGVGTIDPYTSPYTLPVDAEFIMDNVIQVSQNYDYTLALKTTGEVYGWGSNHYERLVREYSTDYNQTTPLLLVSPEINPNVTDFIVPIQMSVPVNSYCYIPIQTEPSNGVFEEIKWSSTDENIASVDNNGFITANSIGECEIHISVQPLDANTIDKIIQLHIEDTGIVENIVNDGLEPIDIFNLNGIKVLHNPTESDINSLLPGIYIKRRGLHSEKIQIR